MNHRDIAEALWKFLPNTLYVENVYTGEKGEATLMGAFADAVIVELNGKQYAIKVEEYN